MRFALLLFVVAFSSSCSISAQKLSIKDLTGLETHIIAVSERYAKKQDVAEKLGDLYVAFTRVGAEFTNAIGEKRSALDDVYLYARKGEKITVLGRIKKYTICDADGKILKKIGQDSPIYNQVVGVSSKVFDDPFGISLVLRTSKGYKETNAFFLLDIDTSKGTISELKPKME